MLLLQLQTHTMWTFPELALTLQHLATLICQGQCSAVNPICKHGQNMKKGLWFAQCLFFTRHSNERHGRHSGPHSLDGLKQQFWTCLGHSGTATSQKGSAKTSTSNWDQHDELEDWRTWLLIFCVPTNMIFGLLRWLKDLQTVGDTHFVEVGPFQTNHLWSNLNSFRVMTWFAGLAWIHLDKCCPGSQSTHVQALWALFPLIQEVQAVLISPFHNAVTLLSLASLCSLWSNNIKYMRIVTVAAWSRGSCLRSSQHTVDMLWVSIYESIPCCRTTSNLFVAPLQRHVVPGGFLLHNLICHLMLSIVVCTLLALDHWI